MRRISTCAAVAASLLVPVWTALAGTTFTITPVVLEGDDVPGVGLITRIDGLAVNNNGDWLIEADTNNVDTNTDTVVLKSGVLFAREGQSLDQPVGASINSVDSINLNGNGDTGWNLFLDGTAGGTTDSGVFFNLSLLIQESTVSTAPQFTAGTPYIGWFEVHTNDNNQLLAMSSVDDVAIATTVDRALVRLDLDLSGALLSETVLAKEADVLPGQTEMVTDFGTGPHASAFNNSGQAMFVADLTGLTTTDGVIYIDGTIVAQEGGDSPVPARPWMTLGTSLRLDLNNNGGYVHTGTLSGDTTTDAVIASNGGIVIQEGSSLPAIGGVFTFTGFGTTPVKIDDADNVFWFGDWNDLVTTQDTGLFRNDTLLVQEGVTVIDGTVLMSVAGVEGAFDVSPNGQFVIFEGTLTGGIDGAFLIEISAAPVLVDIVAANPPPDNPFVVGTQPFRDILQTGGTPALTQGIGAAATPDEDTVNYDAIQVKFSAATTLAAGDVTVTCSYTGAPPGTTPCPTVTSVAALDVDEYSIVLTGAIPPGGCATLTFANTNPGQVLQYESLPGDVNMNDTTSAGDILVLLNAINNGDAALAVNLPRYDINRSGSVGAADVLREVLLGNGFNTTQAWNGVTVVTCP